MARYAAQYIDEMKIGSSEIPKELKNAVCELAYLISEGYDVQPILSSSGDVTEETIKVDVIEEKKTYKSSSITDRDEYTAVDDALARITGGSSRNYIVNIIRK